VKTLVILNDPPYGTERTYNGLRLAHNLLAKAEGVDKVVEGACRSTLDELTGLTASADKVLVF